MTDYGTLRFGERADAAAVGSTWLRSYWDDRPAILQGMDRGRFFANHRERVTTLLERPNTLLFVVSDPEDERHLFAWLCAELTNDALKLHYVYTYKFGDAAFPRGAGFARMLVDRVLGERGKRGVVHTHETKAGRRIARAIGSSYDPWAFA